MELIVAKEFTETPGARYIADGDHSGEEFRDKFLVPKIARARYLGEKLLINLDGGYGYATCFLEEAFGGLIRIHHFTKKELDEIISFKSDEEPYLIEDIENYMSDAEKILDN